jgi:plasmid stabilization system protein ParE
MNRLSHSEPHQNGSSICAELMIRAERELSAFFSAVAELFGPEQAALAAKDWLQQLEVMTDLPTSSRDWRLMSIEASARLAKRVNTNGCAASR